MQEALPQRFGGVARLYGEEALRIFTSAHVAVIGLGGVGSWTVEALARSGIGCLTLVDLDEICLSNVNRQIHAGDGQIGQSKAAVMAQRVLAINPAATVHLQQLYYTPSTSAQILEPPRALHCVVDAIDSLQHKAHLLATCRSRQLPVVTSGGAGGKRDPARIERCDLSRTRGDPLLAKLRKTLRNTYNFPRQTRRRFGITAVYSTELPRYPQSDGSFAENPDPSLGSLRLGCAGGFGTATHLTGSFGFHLAAAVLELLTCNIPPTTA